MQQTDVQARGPAREPASTLDRDRRSAVDTNFATEEEIHTSATDREEAGILQEERSFLRKEQWEAGEVHLRVVDLDLGEVRIDGQVEREALRNLNLRFATDVHVRVELYRSSSVVAYRGTEHIRGGRHGPAKRRLEPRQVTCEIKSIQPELTRHRGPKRFFVQASDTTGNVEAPGRGARPVSERAEGDAKLGVPPLLVPGRRDLPASIPILVEAATGPRLKASAPVRAATEEEASPAPRGSHLAIVFDTRRRRSEYEAVLLVVVSVEHHDDRVRVGHLIVPDRLARHDLARTGIPRPHTDVDRVSIVEDANLGALRRGLPVHRLALNEAGEDLSSLPRSVVEHPVDIRGNGHRHSRRDPWPLLRPPDGRREGEE